MSIHNPIESLASIETGSDVISYLLDTEGLNYSSFVEVPSGINRNQGRNDWYEAHLTDADSRGIIRYIELGASGDSPSFSDLKRQLKRHGSPIDELFTVVAYRSSDKGPLTSPLNDDLTFLYIEEQFSSEDVEVTFDLKYFAVDRFDVEPAYIDFVEDIAVGSGQGRSSLERRIEDVFSIREITRSFYEEFGQLFRETLQDAINGLEAPEENLNAYTRTVVNRVLFLLFIEEKEWLDDDADYIENKYEAAKADEAMHVYDDFFEPLFFEALSDTAATDYGFLGQIPFLNGGLFERRGIETDVHISEEFFDELLSPEEDESGDPKGFLRQYKISLRESNPSEQELVVDPEFIGRIFEMFMQDDERSEVGAFYTPKSITAYMTKNALKQHLLGETDINHDEAVSLVSDHTAPDSLSDGQIEGVDDALRSASILDPAVGSGAFIIAMLEELVAVSEALDKSNGDTRSRFQLKEEFIADTLYGVDIDAGGIELCKFRVWLHLMQDLDVNHEEFLDSNEELALPNLGFKFFVGNSLVGEHDPTNVDAQQATLTGGLDSTLEEIHEVRTEYQTAHGEEKDRLAERLEKLTDELDSQLAVEQSDWMTEVAEETDETFAWTLNIPEVILDGGFDIVVGNPPYEGQSQQGYIGELARFYDKKYDFYKTIPRMRHDLYQKFIIRGWELTREGGVLSYITSNTFYTIGSKQTTRQLLQQNQLLDLLRANPDTFDATVEPAIFVLQKRDPDTSHKFNYIDASETEIQEYRSFVRNLDVFEPDTERVEPLNLRDSSRGYRVQLQIYRDTLRSAFFEPTETNLRLHDQFMSRIKGLAEEWESELQDVTTLKNNTEKITRDHTSQLDAGDVSILGLLTLGGQGMTTDKNAKYMAFLEGTEEAEELAERNTDFELNKRNENAYKYLDKVITEDRVADSSNLSSEEQLNGIDSSKTATWVPIEKGFRQSDLYYKSKVEYINWSKESLQEIQSHRNGILKNVDYYFEPGIFLSIGGFANLKARYTNNRTIDHTGNIFSSTIPQQLSVKYLTGILNSEVPIHITENFINSTGMETADLRLIPIPIPTEEQRESVETLVDGAIESRRGNRPESLESIQSEVEEIVEGIYQVDLDE
jgi:hypothetical protein